MSKHKTTKLNPSRMWGNYSIPEQKQMKSNHFIYWAMKFWTHSWWFCKISQFKKVCKKKTWLFSLCFQGYQSTFLQEVWHAHAKKNQQQQKWEKNTKKNVSQEDGILIAWIRHFMNKSKYCQCQTYMTGKKHLFNAWQCTIIFYTKVYKIASNPIKGCTKTSHDETHETKKCFSFLDCVGKLQWTVVI